MDREDRADHAAVQAGRPVVQAGCLVGRDRESRPEVFDQGQLAFRILPSVNGTLSKQSGPTRIAVVLLKSGKADWSSGY